MGILKAFRDWLRKTYPAAWRTISRNGNGEVPYPEGVTVGILDATFKLKFYPQWITNGIQYVKTHVLSEAADFLNRNDAEAFYLCFDRGSPVNKSAEHAKRYGGLKKLTVSDLDHVPIIDDNVIPNGNDWPNFANDRNLKQELLYYVTKRIVEEHELGAFTFIPPPNKMLFVCGGTLQKPPPRKERLEGKFPKFVPEPKVYYVGHEPEGDPDTIKLSQKYKRVKGCHNVFPESQVSNLLEGEIMAVYFSKFYYQTSVIIISGDGDLIPILLLSSKDRIDPRTGEFRNRLYLRLVKKGGSKGANGERELYEDLDINLLYQLICDDPLFLKTGTRDPIISIMAACCLIQCDFIKGYCDGIGVDTNKGKGIPTPIILKTFLDNLFKYKDMVLIPLADSQRGKIDQVIPVFVNENLFILFTEQCYVTKYLEKAQKKHGTKPGKELDTVKYYLNGLKSTKNKVMSHATARVFSRQLQWVLFYWINGFRGQCHVPSPIAVSLGLPYYGWEQLSPYDCTTARQVSKRSEIDEFLEFFANEKGEKMPIERRQLRVNQ